MSNRLRPPPTHRCSKCQLPCEVYLSRSHFLGVQNLSLCGKAPAVLEKKP